MPHVEIDGVRIERRTILGDPMKPWLVFLHEGLGSAGLWREFPDEVARRTGCRALVYSRRGYGRSGPLDGPRVPEFMHHEALSVLPQLLARFSIERPVLIGHSDGASIALIHAAAAADRAAGIVLMAPHVFVEDISVASIEKVAARYAEGQLRDRLARHHDHVDDAFLGWADVWRLPAFKDWSLAAEIARLSCPALLIQGEDDEYGTLAQIETIAAGANGPVTRLVLAKCGHSPQRDQPSAVARAIETFVAAIS